MNIQSINNQNFGARIKLDGIKLNKSTLEMTPPMTTTGSVSTTATANPAALAATNVSLVASPEAPTTFAGISSLTVAISELITKTKNPS